jgi:hypothetical protein
VWDLIRHLGAMVAADIAQHIEALNYVSVAEPGAVVIGSRRARGARRVDEPYAFDTNAGPMLVRRGAVVSPFSRLVGPLYVGEDTMVPADASPVSSIGEHCRVHGELRAMVFKGHANKSHDGFVGHSYLGRWANLGASTVRA